MKYFIFTFLLISTISVSAQRELSFDAFPPVKNNLTSLEGSGFDIPFIKIVITEVDTASIFVRELLISKDPISLSNYVNYLNLRKSDGDEIKASWLTRDISEQNGNYSAKDGSLPVSNLSYEAIEQFFNWLSFTKNEYANFNGEYVTPDLHTPSIHEFAGYLSHMSLNYKAKNRKTGKSNKGGLIGEIDQYRYTYSSVLSDHKILISDQKRFNRDITIETTIYQYTPDGSLFKIDPEYRVPGSFHLAISIIGRSNGAEY